MMNKKDEYPEQELTREIISVAMEVHTHWGPGLNEKIYELSFCRELILRRIPFTRQLGLPLEYKGGRVADDLALDVFVDGRVIVENKHVADVLPIHKAQLMTYMKITGCRVGLLINYKEVRLKNGIHRIVATTLFDDFQLANLIRAGYDPLRGGLG